MIKDTARVALARWYNQVEGSEFDSFNKFVVALYNTIKNH